MTQLRGLNSEVGETIEMLRDPVRSFAESIGGRCR
jgi:hypothetical protein